jgi:drug/metabolite transporter (DMT)-like permease
MKPVQYIQVVLSTALLVVNQIFLKIWVQKNNIEVWPLNFNFFKSLLSLEILISVLSIGASGFLWLSLLKKIEFSVIYPLISISYIFGLLAAIFIFKESIPIIRWLGVFFIIVGVVFITHK